MSRLGGTNARDIRSLLDGKHPPELVKCMAGLAERQDHLFQLLGQLAHAMDTMANSLLAQTSAVTALRDQHEQIKEAKSIGVKVASGAANEE